MKTAISAIKQSGTRNILTLILLCVFVAGSHAQNIFPRPDIRLFTLYAGFNGCGYDLENVKMEQPFSAPIMSPVRLQVREYLKRKPLEVADLCAFLHSHQKPWFFYTTYILAIGEPPQFKLDKKIYSDMEESIVYSELEGLEKALAAFYAKAGIQEIWNKVLPEYEKEANYYATAVPTWLKDVDEFIKTSGHSSKLSVIPNLLESHHQADVRHLGDKLIILIGPRHSTQNTRSTIVHEYLHTYTRPILQKTMQDLKKFDQIYAQIADKDIKANYNSVSLWIDETTVRVLTYKITGIPYNMTEDKWLDNLVLSGFPIAPEIAKGIDARDKASSLFESLPIILKNVDCEKASLNWKHLTSLKLPATVEKH